MDPGIDIFRSAWDRESWWLDCLFSGKHWWVKLTEAQEAIVGYFFFFFLVKGHKSSPIRVEKTCMQIIFRKLTGFPIQV